MNNLIMKRSIVAAFLLALSLSIPTLSFGQYAEQALKFSYLSYGGTARFTGMGGALGALGGDFTTLSINPAGIGVYKKSEASLTPLIYNTRTFSTYFDNYQEEFRTRLNINNAGLVFAIPIQNSNLKFIQFGLGYNRLANFNNDVYFDGFNSNNSFLRALADDANVAMEHNDFFSDDPYYADELADAVNLFAYDTITGKFSPDMSESVYQSAWMRQEGGIDEMVFTLGSNIANKLYIGATVGITFMSYSQFYQYAEWNNDPKQNFREMNYDDNYQCDGSGINAKLGIIFKPVPFLRIGAAIHTPTYYWLIQESEYMSMTSYFRESTYWNRTASTPERVYEYSQITPMRTVGSLAFVAGKIAIISADYEWVDHSMNKLRTSREKATADANTVTTNANTEMAKLYKSQHIIRAGAAIRLADFYFRGGYGWYGSPYKGEKGNNMNTWSLGAGFRAGAFGLDFAYQHARSKSRYYPYDANRYEMYDKNAPSSFSPFADLTNNANSYILTLTYRY